MLRKNSCRNSRRVFRNRRWCGSTSATCNATGSTPTEALASFRRAIALDPRTGRCAQQPRAACCTSSLRFEDAEREYRECVRIAPDFLLARCNLASVVMDLGRFDEAADIVPRHHRTGARPAARPFISRRRLEPSGPSARRAGEPCAGGAAVAARRENRAELCHYAGRQRPLHAKPAVVCARAGARIRT